MDFDRSTDRGAQKPSKFTIELQHLCIRKSTHFYFRGPVDFSNFFSTARRIFLLLRTASIFRCPTMDFDRSTARGAPKRSKFTLDLQHVCFRKSTHFYFRGPNNFSNLFYGAPLISPSADRIDFSMSKDGFWSVDRSRCSKTIEIYYRVTACLH